MAAGDVKLTLENLNVCRPLTLNNTVITSCVDGRLLFDLKSNQCFSVTLERHTYLFVSLTMPCFKKT